MGRPPSRSMTPWMSSYLMCPRFFAVRPISAL
jgi:hypothetical protein